MSPIPLSTLTTLLLTSPHLKRSPANIDVLNGANFPDPTLITIDNTSYVFGTGDFAGHQLPVTTSSSFDDAASWSPIVDAFPVDSMPAFGSQGWALKDTIWAPDVVQLTDSDNSFAIYYAAALQSNPAIHCLGVARSTDISGPYNDSSLTPWICPEEQGGAIDASSILTSDGTRYVVYKIDGPSVNGGGYCASPGNKPSTPIMLQKVGSDGYTLIGNPVQLLDNLGEVDSYQTEAPSLIQSEEGIWFLFFSSGCYDANSYTASYATSVEGIGGPYEEREVLLQTGDLGLFGPGGLDVEVDGSGRAVWHSLKKSETVSEGRVLNTGVVRFEGRRARVEN